MAKSTLSACFKRVIIVLNELASEVIIWPEAARRREIEASFHRISGLHGVIGAIDGTYVKIKAPKENTQAYVNRKCFTGITLKAVADSSLRFLDCFAGYPSSVSDNRVFRNSDIYRKFIENTEEYFEENQYLIGDKAYPIFRWCIPPYIDRGNLQAYQRNFNVIHARTRQVVERSFALLFGRFRRLRDLDMNRVDLIAPTVLAACVLHNVCLMLPDELINVYIQQGEDAVVANDGEENRRLIDRNREQNLGVAFRDQLARRLQLQ